LSASCRRRGRRRRRLLGLERAADGALGLRGVGPHKTPSSPPSPAALPLSLRASSILSLFFQAIFSLVFLAIFSLVFLAIFGVDIQLSKSTTPITVNHPSSGHC